MPKTQVNTKGKLSWRLSLIASELLKILPELNEGGKACECCGVFRYENFSDKQAADALRGAVGRIDRTVKRLDEEGR